MREELVRAARRAGLGVREEPFDPQLSDVRRPRGGLCTLHGKRILLVDSKLPLPEQVATLAISLASLDLEHLYLPPLVRATIDRHRRVGGERVRPALMDLGPLFSCVAENSG
jgi:hypothetical protein